jgi:hypothetical protein
MTEFEFELLGRRVHAQGSHNVSSILKELFEHPAISDALESSWRITVTHRPEEPVPNQLEGAYRAEIHAGFVMVKPEGDRLWVVDDDHAVHVTVQQPEIRLQLTGSAARGGGALMVAMLEALRVTGLIPLHASIAANDGEATAFIGASGRGKTTTLITALTRGFTPICEDFALLEPISHQVFGLDRGLRCLPDTFERLRAHFPHLEDQQIVRGKRFVPYESIAPRAWSANLKRFWMLERDLNAPTRIEPLPPSQRVMALFTASGAPLLEAGREFTSSQFSRLSRELEIQRLWLGNTPIDFG